MVPRQGGGQVRSARDSTSETTERSSGDTPTEAVFTRVRSTHKGDGSTPRAQAPRSEASSTVVPLPT